MNGRLWRLSREVLEGMRLLESVLPARRQEPQPVILHDPDGEVRRNAAPRKGFIGVRQDRE